MSYIQSILFDKSKYSLDDVVKILKKNKDKHNKIDITENFYRARQIEPDYLKKHGIKKVYTHKAGKGIEFIMYYK